MPRICAHCRDGNHSGSNGTPGCTGGSCRCACPTNTTRREADRARRRIESANRRTVARWLREDPHRYADVTPDPDTPGAVVVSIGENDAGGPLEYLSSPGVILPHALYGPDAGILAGQVAEYSRTDPAFLHDAAGLIADLEWAEAGYP